MKDIIDVEKGCWYDQKVENIVVICCYRVYMYNYFPWGNLAVAEGKRLHIAPLKE